LGWFERAGCGSSRGYLAGLQGVGHNIESQEQFEFWKLGHAERAFVGTGNFLLSGVVVGQFSSETGQELTIRLDLALAFAI
jgi:hypothetical protein